MPLSQARVIFPSVTSKEVMQNSLGIETNNKLHERIKPLPLNNENLLDNPQEDFRFRRSALPMPQRRGRFCGRRRGCKPRPPNTPRPPTQALPPCGPLDFVNCDSTKRDLLLAGGAGVGAGLLLGGIASGGISVPIPPVPNPFGK